MASQSQRSKTIGMSRRAQDHVLLQKLGSRLRQLREASGLTQQRLAELVQLKPPTISLFESGEFAPTLTTATALARVLRVRLPDLFDFDNDVCTTSNPCDIEEAEVLAAYRVLPTDHQVLIRGILRAMAPHNSQGV